MKVTMLTALDLKSNPWLHFFTRFSGFIANKLLKANFKWQTLSAPFTIHLEGLNVNAFEEFEAGALLRDIKDDEMLYQKINEPEFRKAFKKQVKAVFTVGLWHRDFSDCWITDCPDKSLIGKNFEEIGRLRNADAVDTYFDLATQYREQLRWKTNYGNHREKIMHKLLASPSTHIGFADSGAHVRQLAMYNFPLRMLKYARDAELSGKPFMTNAEAVNKVTEDLSDWFGLNSGTIKIGDRADIVIINPKALEVDLDKVCEAEMLEFKMKRLVKRNDDVVEATIINGKIAYQKDKEFADDFGVSHDYGQFLTGTHVY